MILDDIAMALVQVLIAIAAALIELMVHLGAAMFGASYMAARHTGWIRAGFTILAVGCAYLLFGIARWMHPALATPALTPLYSTWGFVVVLTLLVVGLFLVTLGAEHDPDQPTKTGTPHWLIHLFSYGLAILLLLAFASGGSSTAHRRTLEDRACAALNDRVTTTQTDQITNGLALADRLLDTDLSGRLPCLDAEQKD